jgi:hypothetical protein
MLNRRRTPGALLHVSHQFGREVQFTRSKRIVKRSLHPTAGGTYKPKLQPIIPSSRKAVMQ